MSPRTKTGQEVLRFLQEHPEETSPTVVAKATGCTRPTAREYIRRWQKERQNAAPSTPEGGGNQAPAAPEGGRDFDADYPAESPPRKAESPRPAPQPDPESEPEPDAEPEDDDGWWF
jgi:hypothetical protein